MQKNTKKHFNLTSKQLQTEHRVKLENKETITDFSSILFLSAYFCFQPLFASKSPFYLSSPFLVSCLLLSFILTLSFLPAPLSALPHHSLFLLSAAPAPSSEGEGPDLRRSKLTLCMLV